MTSGGRAQRLHRAGVPSTRHADERPPPASVFRRYDIIDVEDVRRPPQTERYGKRTKRTARIVGSTMRERSRRFCLEADGLSLP